MAETVKLLDKRVGAVPFTGGTSGFNVPIQTPANPGAGTVGGVTKRRVHCWTADPTWRAEIGMGDDDRRVATEHSKKGDEIVEIPFIDAFERLMRDAGFAKKRIDYLDFHTHGAPGFVALAKPQDGEYGFSWSNLSSWDSFDGAMNPGSTLEFHGCNIGDEFEGEYFLYEVCVRLMRVCGGTVGASTGAGLAFGDIELIYIPNQRRAPTIIKLTAEKGATFHPGGDWVSWEARPSDKTSNMIGTNISWYHKLNVVVEDCKRRIAAAKRLRSDKHLDSAADLLLFDHLKRAENWLKIGAQPVATPTHLDVCFSRSYIRTAEKMLSDAPWTANQPPRPTQPAGTPEAGNGRFASNGSSNAFGTPDDSVAVAFTQPDEESTSLDAADEAMDSDDTTDAVASADAAPEESDEQDGDAGSDEDETIVAETESEEDEAVVAEAEPEEDETVVAEAEPEEDETVVAETEPEEDESVVT